MRKGYFLITISICQEVTRGGQGGTTWEQGGNFINEGRKRGENLSRGGDSHQLSARSAKKD